ncbi:hypothetical protein D6789_03350 [Candidatus Woesearchaeota archaeon]|nr:MAG: hypothetical protein D6789_03350 [Candidatus Woesearchaeota archaeon]
MSIAEMLKEAGVVQPGNVRLSSGGTAAAYFDVKRAYGSPHVLRILAKTLAERLPRETTTVAAMGYGGITLASVIAAQQDYKLTLVREKEKSHGLPGLLHGYVPSRSDAVAIIDDVCTTGGSLQRVITALESTGARILGGYVVVQRGIVQNAAPVVALVHASELTREKFSLLK